MEMEVLTPQELQKQKQRNSFDNLKFDVDDADVEGPYLYDMILPNLRNVTNATTPND